MSTKRNPPRGSKKEKAELPRVHPDLAGFNVEINSFGEVKMNYDLDQLNLFLNKNVKDKKFRGRDDVAGVPEAFQEPALPEDSTPWKDPDDTTHLESEGINDLPTDTLDEAELPLDSEDKE